MHVLTKTIFKAYGQLFSTLPATVKYLCIPLIDKYKRKSCTPSHVQRRDSCQKAFTYYVLPWAVYLCFESGPGKTTCTKPSNNSLKPLFAFMDDKWHSCLCFYKKTWCASDLKRISSTVWLKDLIVVSKVQISFKQILCLKCDSCRTLKSYLYYVSAMYGKCFETALKCFSISAAIILALLKSQKSLPKNRLILCTQKLTWHGIAQ